MSLGAFGLSINGSASDLSITGGGTAICTPITGLVGMQALLASFRFAYGSGGTTAKAYLQGSADQGNTWFDMYCFAAALADKRALINLSALTPKLTAVDPTDGTLTDDTAVDGMLPDRVRLKVIVVGTYAGGTLLAARMVAR